MVWETFVSINTRICQGPKKCHDHSKINVFTNKFLEEMLLKCVNAKRKCIIAIAFFFCLDEGGQPAVLVFLFGQDGGEWSAVVWSGVDWSEENPRAQTFSSGLRFRIGVSGHFFVWQPAACFFVVAVYPCI